MYSNILQINRLPLSSWEHFMGFRSDEEKNRGDCLVRSFGTLWMYVWLVDAVRTLKKKVCQRVRASISVVIIYYKLLLKVQPHKWLAIPISKIVFTRDATPKIEVFNFIFSSICQKHFSLESRLAVSYRNWLDELNFFFEQLMWNMFVFFPFAQAHLILKGIQKCSLE